MRLEVKATTKDAYMLLHEGALALSEIEANGICIDLQYCYDQQKRLSRKIEQLEEKLDSHSEVKVWKEHFGSKFKLNSDEQLAWLLFNKLGLPSVKLTENESESVDQSVLDQIDLPFVKELLQYRRYGKARDTYIEGIIRETVETHYDPERKIRLGILRPMFNLNTVVTFRSSSSNINFQNQPVRQKEIKRIIRSAFIPRRGHRLGGIDYSGIEVRIASCYHKDPTMLDYIRDPHSDMHRDQAMEIFLLPEDEVVKDTRFYAKNGFVFPQFYGDWWKACAEFIWGAITQFNLKTKSGMPIKEHLRQQGIKELGTYAKGTPLRKGTFYYHMRDVEDRFWNERFPVYKQWKEDWIKQYEKDGYVDMYTGFRCSGIMGRNDVVNYPIQGVAFHCLLWSLIRLQAWHKEQQLRSKIVGQIHDEIVPDSHPDELPAILREAKKVMCDDIKDYWDFLIVPLDIEAEFCPVGGTWVDKEPIKIV